MLLGSDGRLIKGDPGENEGWCTYDVPVLAVSDAVVVHARDGLPENVPLSEERAVPNKRDKMTGNCIVLELTDGRYAFYGHLQPNSLLVQIGDRVSAGQVLARIGNSGNSDAPHLHFHVANSPAPLSGEGIPYAFSSFVLLDVIDVPTWQRLLGENASWEPPEERQPVRCTNEMPVGEAIIEFR
jgi:murein DD-endopeptidase MepM/ murein hydrolase activator NlpD